MESVLSAACRKPTKGSLRVEYSPQLRLTAPCQPTGVPCWVRNCMQYARHYLSATVLSESLGNSVRRRSTTTTTLLLKLRTNDGMNLFWG
jgi:hypothetical protein